MSDIFISYAREDLDRVRSVAQALNKRGWSVFWDREILPGEMWRQVIDKELGEARCVLVVWSHASVKSHWVIEEAEEGRQRGILIPIRINDVKPPRGFREIQGADLFGPDPGNPSPEFESLVRNISGEMVSKRRSPLTRCEFRGPLRLANTKLHSTNSTSLPRTQEENYQDGVSGQ